MDKNQVLNNYSRVPLMSLDDSEPAWNNDDVPCIPKLSEIKQSISNDKNTIYEEIKLTDNYDDTKNLSRLDKLKINVIRERVTSKLSYGDLKLLGCSNLGLVTDDIRKILWPQLLRIEGKNIPSIDELNDIHKKIQDSVYQQILKDVARSGGHLPADASELEHEKFQDKLVKIICWVLYRHPELNYYQGYNDVAATILIVMGLEKGLCILERITLEFLERFMEPTMERVNQELFYIFALLERIHPKLLEHLENVELFPHFALAEYTTWYAHKYAENRKLLHRLFDFFLGTQTLMPLYLSTVIVAHRATEIFNTTPDMGHTHKVLCTLSDDLPFEELLITAKNLYRDYPPDSISNDVYDYDHKRKRKEKEWKIKAENNRIERERLRKLKVAIPQSRMPYRLRSYSTITVVTILAIGIYAFLKTGTSIN
ncbi:hypothetical protein HCN44_005725 [Aphidius gifuensis]|uniref:Rab-GAP TBC domain-containing protein n=1 Tax=Aphidius gifuensis TaxID=684658 RepID=A0A835CRL0_APHGI|nr:TBC1 domain family member 20 [Aphidius gifuensis]KAF7992944.1 hypothetical protein HCN44_005725 [Aphidius gifuensis]